MIIFSVFLNYVFVSIALRHLALAGNATTKSTKATTKRTTKVTKTTVTSRPNGTTKAPADEVGHAAENGQFPFVVRLYMRGLTSVASCTGSIIKEGLILTAGRCCEIDAHNSEVVLGKANHDLYAHNVDREGYYIYKVKDKYINPNLDRTDKRVKNDLCMLTLHESMRGDGHEVARYSTEKIDGNRSCTVITWGRKGPNYSANTLSYRTVEMYVCGDYYCTQRKRECAGDPGRPLVCDDKIVGIGSSAISYLELLEKGCKSGTDYYCPLSTNRAYVEQMKCSIYPSSGTRDRVQALLMSLILVGFW